MADRCCNGRPSDADSPLPVTSHLPLSFCRQGVAWPIPSHPCNCFLSSCQPAHVCVCVSELVCLCDGIPWQSRNAKSALPYSFSPQPPLTLSLSLSHSLSVGLQLFCKEVPSNCVLNVKFKWQSSSNEMMLGAGNWKPEFADGSATGIVVPPRLHFMICEFVANLQLLL